WGIRDLVGKGMGVGMADYDLDGRPDLFITNDTSYNFLLHNTGKKFEEVAFSQGVALVEDGEFISGMGVDFRDYNNDGYPDIVLAALNNQTFPIYRNKAGKGFEEVTYASGMRQLSRSMAAMAPAFMTLTTMVGKICSSRAGMWNRFRSPVWISSNPTRYFAIWAQAGNGRR